MFRRLIKFGDSSYVISIPKKWVSKNNLNKGDILVCEEMEDGLRIFPQGKAVKPKIKEVNINADEVREGELRHLISSAYVNNFGIINLYGENILSQISEIRNALADLIALEIIQQTSKKIVLKDFLDIKDVSVLDTIKRIDRIVLSICDDVIQFFGGNDVENLISQKETDVNRMAFMLWKVLRRCNDPRVRQDLDITSNEVLYYWGIVVYMEKAADQLKRIPRYDVDLSRSKTEFVNESVQLYKDAMRSFYNSSIKAAIEVKSKKKALLMKSELIFKDESIVSEKIKNFLLQATDISTLVILFPVDGYPKN